MSGFFHSLETAELPCDSHLILNVFVGGVCFRGKASESEKCNCASREASYTQEFRPSHQRSLVWAQAAHSNKAAAEGGIYSRREGDKLCDPGLLTQSPYYTCQGEGYLEQGIPR